LQNLYALNLNFFQNRLILTFYGFIKITLLKIYEILKYCKLA